MCVKVVFHISPMLCNIPICYNKGSPLVSISKQGPVVQSIVSLTSSLRGQLVKCFMTLLPNTLILFVEKMREAFALQKLPTFFQKKNIGKFKLLTFEILTNVN